MKISCNVVKDLLTGYLEGICSEETKELVEEHLNQCEECRTFTRQIAETDCLEKGERETINYMKKIQWEMNIRAVLPLVFALVILVPVAIYSKSNYGVVPLPLYYLEMPVLMIASFMGFFTESNQSQRGKTEKVLGILAVLLVCYLPLVELIFEAGVRKNSYPLGLEAEQVGSFLQGQVLLSLFCGIVILVTVWVRSWQRKRFMLLTQNLAWLAIHVALSYSTMLHRLDSTLDDMILMRNKNLVFLFLEAVVTNVILAVIERRNQKFH
ncbi:MAG: zf-HC2 domain-containing protein [Lachnospiraceae bacterium]|nr:zf-HC2 domain-containing protein [Lachnospiraceae bacterium]